jgi:hypothetical protein
VDGSDHSEESGDEEDEDNASSKPAPKTKSTLGKRKVEFSSRKPKRAYLASVGDDS